MASQPEEEVDIDLKDPEVAKAAMFMQKGFRGLQARRKASPKVTLAHACSVLDISNVARVSLHRGEA